VLLPLSPLRYDVSPLTVEKVRKTWSDYKQHFKINDSTNSIPEKSNSTDIVFTSPPYWNIEKYENVNGQLSSYRDYKPFLKRYELLINECCRISKKYIVFVVGNFRHRKKYYDLVYDTQKMFYEHGYKLFDKIILSHDISHPMSGNKCLRNNHTRSANEEILIFVNS